MNAAPDPAPRRRGRRSGGTDTRSGLLDAARAEFAERGFEGATVRRIAERAGVDPAMVNHWFGGKEKLFTASLELPLDVHRVRGTILTADPDDIGEAVVRGFLTVWDGAEGGAIAAMLRSVTAHPTAARMLREFITRAILRPVVERVSPDRHDERGALVASQLIGIGMMRFVVGLEPLASAPQEEIVAAVGPTVQRYLTGNLGSTNPDS
ncbi:TetR/AcrR family transcriptional regulator [Pseudonocardia phyllosphaerae]|uniref:TetR/AcrR family transcriptional regulator n=1 Tax=Pseudonocardia phyllosphaerae TaxID=3390502 RepID=UPI00397A77F1